jgi:hypothetical protein
VPDGQVPLAELEQAQGQAEVGVVVGRVALDGAGEGGLGGGEGPTGVVGPAEQFVDRAGAGGQGLGPLQHDHRLVGVPGRQQGTAALVEVVGLGLDRGVRHGAHGSR